MRILHGRNDPPHALSRRENGKQQRQDTDKQNSLYKTDQHAADRVCLFEHRELRGQL